MKTLVILSVLALFTITQVGCDSAGDPDNVRNFNPSSVVDYGNGVYYFPYTKDNFGNALSKFIQEHGNLEVAAITGNGTLGHGNDDGYFVVFRSKTK